MPVSQPQRTLRNLSGNQLWLPIGGRMRGLPGSGGVYDSTNNSIQDQTSYLTPENYAVKSLRLVFSGFDISNQGEVDRVPSISGYASIYYPSFNITITTSNSSSAGTNVLFFTPGTNTKNAPMIGQTVSGTNIPASTYVTATSPAYNVGGDITAYNVTVNNNFTGGGVANGASIAFGGQIVPAKFGGNRQFTLEPMHDFLVSDPINIEIPSNTQFFVRVFSLWSSNSLLLMAGPSQNITGEASQRGIGLTDSTLNPLTPTNTGGGFFCPAAIIGQLSTNNPLSSVEVMGDSIAAGFNDTADASGHVGYVNKTLTNTTCFASMARGGLLAVQAVANNTGGVALGSAISATVLLLTLGRNDIWTGRSAAQLLGDLQTVAAPFLAQGIQVFVNTVPPTTTSTDGWATLVNQTVANAGYETQRLAFNVDIKANYASYGFAGVVDVCASWEAVSAPGKWRVDLGVPTTDGIHPNPVLHDQAVTDGVIPVARFAA